MPLSVIAGAFQASYAPYSASTFSYASLGNLTNDGITERETVAGSELTTGIHGETVMDGISGGGGMILEFVLQEANLAAVRNLIKPFYYDSDSGFAQNTSGTNALEGAVTPAGMLWSTMAGRLALTPLVGTTADYGDTTSHVRYYKHVVLNNGQEIRKILNYRERFIPVSLRVLPYMDSGNILRFWEYVAAGSVPTS